MGEGKRELNSPPVNVGGLVLDGSIAEVHGGQRGVHPGDAGSVLMKAAAANLSPTDLRNVVAYIAKNLTVTPPLQRSARPRSDSWQVCDSTTSAKSLTPAAMAGDGGGRC